MSIHQVAALCCVKWRIGCHVKSVTCDRKSDFVKNIPAKFHPDPIQNNGALGFLKRSPQQEEEQQEKDDE